MSLVTDRRSIQDKGWDALKVSAKAFIFRLYLTPLKRSVSRKTPMMLYPLVGWCSTLTATSLPAVTGTVVAKRKFTLLIATIKIPIVSSPPA